MVDIRKLYFLKLLYFRPLVYQSIFVLAAAIPAYPIAQSLSDIRIHVLDDARMDLAACARCILETERLRQPAGFVVWSSWDAVEPASGAKPMVSIHFLRMRFRSSMLKATAMRGMFGIDLCLGLLRETCVPELEVSTRTPRIRRFGESPPGGDGPGEFVQAVNRPPAYPSSWPA